MNFSVTTEKICLISLFWMVIMTITSGIPGISAWIAAPLALVGAIAIPGLLLAINLRLKLDTFLEYSLYIFALGLSFLLIGTLSINWILPLIGIPDPLSIFSLLAFLNTSVLILCVYAYTFNKQFTLEYHLKQPDNVNIFFGIVPLFFVILSVLGTFVLNNGGDSLLTLLMLFGISLYVIALVYKSDSVQEWVYFSALYCIGLSLLLMYSLRSSHILGWDINLEYQVFQTTLKNLVWKMAYYPSGEYNSCISITVLPTVLKQLTHVPSEYIFKLVIQLLFALTPPMVYVIAKKYVQEIFAFLAAFLLLSQTWFYEQMPALIRQQIAFIFYIIIVITLFNTSIKKRTRYILFYIFNISLVLSHYSTAYVWFSLLAGVVIISYASRYITGYFQGKSLTVSPVILIIPLVFLFIWQVPITGTGGALKNVVTQVDIDVPNTPAVPSPEPTKGTGSAEKDTVSSPLSETLKNILLKSIFIDTNENTQENLTIAQEKTMERHKEFDVYTLYSQAEIEKYSTYVVNEKVYTQSSIPSYLNRIFSIIIQGSKVIMIDILPLLGIYALYQYVRRRSEKDAYDFTVFNVTAYIFIILMVCIPWLQQYYNFSRLYLQMFITLSISGIIGGIFITERYPRYRKIILTALIILVFYSFTGAYNQISGGEARITLNQSPSAGDTFYIHDSETASAVWLAKYRAVAYRVQSDIIANLRLQSFGNFSGNYFALFPQTLEKESYVYAIAHNIKEGYGYYIYQNNLLVYNYPIDFLDANKSMIYSNGKSRIYK